MPCIRINKSAVDRIPAPLSGQVLYFDEELTGFGLRVGQKAKTYFAQRLVNGQTVRRVTIGRHGVFTPEQARKEAIQILATMSRGIDPVEKKRTEAQDKKTLEQLLEE